MSRQEDTESAKEGPRAQWKVCRAACTVSWWVMARTMHTVAEAIKNFKACAICVLEKSLTVGGGNYKYGKDEIYNKPCSVGIELEV